MDVSALSQRRRSGYDLDFIGAEESAIEQPPSTLNKLFYFPGGAFGFVRAQRFTSEKLCFIEGAALRICPRRRGGGEDTADSLWSGLNVIESGQKWKSLAAAADERGDGSGRRTLNT